MYVSAAPVERHRRPPHFQLSSPQKNWLSSGMVSKPMPRGQGYMLPSSWDTVEYFECFGLIFGKSGSGKTTLLQLLARLNKPTSGSICIQWYGDDGQPNADPELLPTEKLGIVFQFPERFFVADNVLDEITFGWPRQKGSLQLKEQLISNLQRAINWYPTLPGLVNGHIVSSDSLA
ncbi:hypothetical protein N665_0149s0022 [Sinapis alba]|nr:hypothetical protein N665_0149s0022 [Sinapis alba]